MSAAAGVVRVAAGRSIVNDLVRIGRFHERPGIAADIGRIALAAMLGPVPER